MKAYELTLLGRNAKWIRDYIKQYSILLKLEGDHVRTKYYKFNGVKETDSYRYSQCFLMGDVGEVNIV